jgi:lipoprotein-anchoring transpeptidase ErfK/SrfK
MGSPAMTLAEGQYAIHGTNQPESIGTFASYGCVRMDMEGMAGLFESVNVGASVIVTPWAPPGGKL